jgi:hypothetical protein
MKMCKKGQIPARKKNSAEISVTSTAGADHSFQTGKFPSSKNQSEQVNFLNF